MEAAGGQDYVGVNENFLLMEDSKNNTLRVKTIYRYGEKKHIVEVLDARNPEAVARWWYLIKLKKGKVEPLDVEEETMYDDNITLKAVTGKFHQSIHSVISQVKNPIVQRVWI